MSLLSQINYAATLAHGSNTFTSSSDGLSLAIEAAKKAAAAKQTSSTATSSSVSISNAATEAADRKKDFTVLSGEVRTELDAQYAKAKTAGKRIKPDLKALSGRALAAVVLNRTSAFSSAERAAARLELRDRQRSEFKAAAASGSILTGVQAYSSQLVSRFDAMSDEEREARGWNQGTRASAAQFVQASSVS